MKDAYKQGTINLLLGKPLGDELTSLPGEESRKEEEEEGEESDSVEKEQNLKVVAQRMASCFLGSH